MSTTTKFTHGPWVACERGDYADDGIVILGDDRRLAVVNTEDDALLISAAPDMFEALEGIEHFSDALNYRDDTLSVELRKWINAGRAALAKARGEG